MLFSTLQKAYFNADEGAYSLVTSREHIDGQITLTDSDGEKPIAFAHFGEGKIPRTNSELPISVWLSPNEIFDSRVKLRFPKSTGGELRIYASKESRFQFNSGDVWFIYRSEGRLVVGSMSEFEWRAIGVQDDNDAAYQESIEGTDKATVPEIVDYQGRRFPRVPAVANAAIEKSGYLCAFTGEPTPFISRRTGHPYLEAHHLIPLKLQSRFDFNLDQVGNIVALNPLWHRAIHHAIYPTVNEIVTCLANRREAFLGRHNLAPADIVRLYGCEEIA